MICGMYCLQSQFSSIAIKTLRTYMPFIRTSFIVLPLLIFSTFRTKSNVKVDAVRDSDVFEDEGANVIKVLGSFEMYT
jgi:hypothetical protein